ncbi:MAG: hypothetical protein QXF12_03990 [Candidatus Aenigmatarchaeota archaeon]
MYDKILDDITNKVYLENFNIENKNLIVLYFYSTNNKESGIISHFFNKRFSCLIDIEDNITRVFLISEKRIDIKESKIKIYKDTKSNYIEKPVIVYQTGDKTYINISTKNINNKTGKVKYVNGKRINRSISLPKFIDYLKQIKETNIEDIKKIIESDNMLYDKKLETNFMTEKDYYGRKVYTIKKFSQYYEKNINEINIYEVLLKLKQSEHGVRNIMFFYAVFYYKILENIYFKYGIDLGFNENIKSILKNMIYEIFSNEEKENIQICEYILNEHNFKNIDDISQSIYNSVIKNLQKKTGVSLKLYSYNNDGKLYYYHDFKNPNNKDRFLIVKRDNKTQIFSCDKDISYLMNSHSFIKIYDTKNMRYYYIIRTKSNANLIRIINGIRVYPEKYVIAAIEHSPVIVLYYKDNTETRIKDKDIGYIAYNCLKFLSENVNDKIKFKTLGTTKYLFNKNLKDITQEDIKSYLRNNACNLKNLSINHEYDFLCLFKYLREISLIKGVEPEYIEKHLIDMINQNNR